MLPPSPLRSELESKAPILSPEAASIIRIISLKWSNCMETCSNEPSSPHLTLNSYGTPTATRYICQNTSCWCLRQWVTAGNAYIHITHRERERKHQKAGEEKLKSGVLQRISIWKSATPPQDSWQPWIFPGWSLGKEIRKPWNFHFWLTLKFCIIRGRPRQCVNCLVGCWRHIQYTQTSKTRKYFGFRFSTNSLPCY